MNIAGISAWVNEKADDIRGELVLGGQSLSLFEAKPVANVGVVKVPKFSVDIVKVSACSSTPTGSTNLLQTSITTCQLDYLTEFCQSKLRAYFPAQIMSNNVLDEMMPYAEKITKQWQDEIQKEKERIAWVGSVVAGDCAGGLYGQLSGDTSRNKASGTTFYVGVTITAALIDDAVDAVYNALPGTVKFNAGVPVYIFMSETLFAWYRTWAVGAYGALNIGNAGQLTQGALNMIDYVYNPNVKVVGIAALNSTQHIIAGAKDNFILLSNGKNAEFKAGVAPYDSGIFYKWAEIFGVGYYEGGEMATSF